MRKLALVIVVAAAALILVLWLWPARGGDSDATGGAEANRSEGGRVHPAGSAERNGGQTTPEALAAERAREGGAGDAGALPGAREADAPATAEDGLLEVKVTAAGKPVARTQVHLYLRGLRDPNTNAISWRGAGAAATGEDGLARLPARPGSYLVSANAEGFAAARQEVLRPSGEKLTRVSLALERGAALIGRTVVKGSREPLPLAELSLTFEGAAAAERWKRVDAPAEEKVAAASDPRGQFRIEGLASGAWRLEARAVGHGKTLLKGVQVPRAGELVVELAAAGVIEGFVVAGDGSAASGATVSVAGGEEEVVVSTGQGGGFAAEVGQGTFTLSAKRGTETGALPGKVSVAAGASVRGITIRLGASCGIEGTVVAKSDGAPVPGASVDVSPYKQTGDSGRTVTDAAGAYSVAGLPPGSYDVVVTAAGFAQLERRGITVAAGQRFPLTLELEGTGAVEGTVTDEGGKPITSAVVRGSSRWGGPGGMSQAEARTDEQGRFRLAELQAGKVSVQARREGASTGASKLVDVVEGQTARADFVLAENGFVTGTVTRKSGAPLTQPVTVRAGLRRRGRMGAPDFASAAVDAQGGYQLTLPPGSWNLAATVDRPGRGPGNGTSTEVEAGKTQRVDLVLNEDDAAGVSGVVLEPSGAPSPFALVSLSAASANNRSMRMYGADEEGRFQFPSESWMTGAQLKLSARNGGRRSEWVVTTAGAGEVTVKLQPAAVLAGRVVSEGGDPVSSFSVSTTLVDGDSPRSNFRGQDTLEFTGDRFELSDVPAGHLKVSVLTRDGRTGGAETTVAPGGRGEVTVTLQAGASLSGVVLASDTKAPVAEAFVTVDGKSPDTGHGGVGPDGRFRISNLGPGEHGVQAFARRYRGYNNKVTLAVGQVLDLGEVVLTKLTAPPGSVGVGFAMSGALVQISNVAPESPAEQAGLREGDVVMSIDGAMVTSIADASKRARGAPGTPVSFMVRRGGNQQSFQVTRAN